MDVFSNLGYVIFLIILAVLYSLSTIVLFTKPGSKSLTLALVVFSIFVLSAGVLDYYILNKFIMTDDRSLHKSGKLYLFITNLVLTIVGFIITFYVSTSFIGTINVYTFNYISAFLVFLFCLTFGLITIINKMWNLQSSATVDMVKYWNFLFIPSMVMLILYSLYALVSSTGSMSSASNLRVNNIVSNIRNKNF